MGFELGLEKNNLLPNEIRTPPPPSPFMTLLRKRSWELELGWCTVLNNLCITGNHCNRQNNGVALCIWRWSVLFFFSGGGGRDIRDDSNSFLTISQFLLCFSYFCWQVYWVTKPELTTWREINHFNEFRHLLSPEVLIEKTLPLDALTM